MKQLNAKHKQSGGTFFGFVLGLVIGLGIAVVVAMFITKTPTPFVDRFAHHDDPSVDQRVDSAGGVLDPNQPLYGNNNAPAPVIKPAPSAPATASNAQPSASDDPIADLLASKGEIPAPKNTAPVPAAKATPAAPSAKPVSPVASANSNADDSWIYFLQTGAFRGWNEAESERARLALLGFEAKVSERTADGSTMYRVRMGPYTQMDAMNKVSSKLSDNGVNYSVIRTKKTSM